jgi:hypothetical protein
LPGVDQSAYRLIRTPPVAIWETDMMAWHNPMSEQRCVLPGGSCVAFTGILVDYREGSAKPGRWRR